MRVGWLWGRAWLWLQPPLCAFICSRVPLPATAGPGPVLSQLDVASVPSLEEVDLRQLVVGVPGAAAAAAAADGGGAGGVQARGGSAVRVAHAGVRVLLSEEVVGSGSGPGLAAVEGGGEGEGMDWVPEEW